MADKMREGLVGMFIIFCVMVAIAVALAFFGASKVGQTDVSDLLSDAPEVKNGSRVMDAPQDFDERATAEASALIPARVGIPETGPGAHDEHAPEQLAPPEPGLAVPPGEFKRLQNTVTDFLKVWEDYGGSTVPALYEQRLQPLVMEESLPTLAIRGDSIDPPGACLTCVAHSQLIEPYPSIMVIDYDGSNAYVVAPGRVRFDAGDASVDPLHGRTGSRSYGIVLHREGEKWLVSRAAAETVYVD